MKTYTCNMHYIDKTLSDECIIEQDYHTWAQEVQKNRITTENM